LKRAGLPLALVGLLVVGAVVEGCASMGSIVRTRASREFRCDLASTQVEALDEHAYRATACGHEATYVCSHQPSTFSWSGEDTVCVREAPSAQHTVVINNIASGR
jgi:hypothetical protein